MVWLSDREKSLRTRFLVFIQYIEYTNVTDRQTYKHRAAAQTALMHSIARQKRFVGELLLLLLLLRERERERERDHPQSVSNGLSNKKLSCTIETARWMLCVTVYFAK